MADLVLKANQKRAGRCPVCKSLKIKTEYKHYVGATALYNYCECHDCGTEFQEWFKYVFAGTEIIRSYKKKGKNATTKK